ncbi:MAG: lytic transglycosylase domain-containing protein [Candidatus Saganbacteria bacterium]|nr:lytic transglycosylase domain-containing protein [Candidatus Saganbacteria bacterium]
MDATSVIVILIFAFSIISGVTGVKDSQYAKTPAQTPSGTYLQKPAHLEVPGPNFQDGVINDLQSRIDSFIRKYARKTSRADAPQIAESIVRYSRKYNVNPRLVTALVARESRFNKYAVSSAGAQGLGQLMPSTARGLKVYNSFDIDQNIMGTSRYMRYLFNRFKNKQNQVPFGIAGYLEGPNAVKRNNGYKSSSSGYIKDILKIYQKI